MRARPSNTGANLLPDGCCLADGRDLLAAQQGRCSMGWRGDDRAAWALGLLVLLRH